MSGEREKEVKRKLESLRVSVSDRLTIKKDIGVKDNGTKIKLRTKWTAK